MKEVFTIDTQRGDPQPKVRILTTKHTKRTKFISKISEPFAAFVRFVARWNFSWPATNAANLMGPKR